MPIHQTKLTMAKPQPTGMFTPQMPTPFTSRYAIETMQQVGEREREQEPDPPAERRLARQDDRADLVGDRAERVSRRDHRRRAAADHGLVRIFDRDKLSVMFDRRQCHSPSSGFTFRTAAR